MKLLFIGGIKSGKSHLAETEILKWTPNLKPYYLATNECNDEDMKKRIFTHQQRRENRFETIEEPIKLLKILQRCQRPVLIECVTMWLNNMLFYQFSEQVIFEELEAIMKLPIDAIFVHNEVGLGGISDNVLARKFADVSGRAGQLIAQYCEQVYFCSAGLRLPMK